MGSLDWFAARAIPRTETPVLLRLEDYRQTEDTNCGDIGIDVYLAYRGIPRKRGTRLSNPVQGLAPDTIAAVLRLHGLVVGSQPILTGVAGLKHLVEHDFPILCPVNLYGGHWVTVFGVGRKVVHFHCPADGFIRTPIAEWLSVWHDTSAEPGHRFERWGICAGR